MLPEGKVVTHCGSGPHPTRQEAPHVHFVGATPDHKWLLAVDLGVDAIYMYSPDLQTSQCVSVPAGHGCRHLAWSEDGRYCFCINELASSLSVLRYDQDTLVLLDTVALLPEKYQGNNTAAAIRVAGENIYLTVRGCDQIITLTHHNGVLTTPRLVASEGESPRDMNVIGDLLFCANENSNCVTAFSLQEGGPKFSGLRLPVPKPLCIVFREK
jgi:6-phosphogluconolactonase